MQLHAAPYGQTTCLWCCPCRVLPGRYCVFGIVSACRGVGASVADLGELTELRQTRAADADSPLVRTRLLSVCTPG